MKEFNFDIWRLQAQSNVRGLLDALKSPDPVLRQRAAMALRVMGSASALPALQDALLAETHKETRDIIIATLESLFSQEHEDDSAPTRSGSQVVQFIARLNSANTEHAVRAAQGLGDIQEKLAVEALMVTFNNRQLTARVRLAAAEALIQLQCATADISLLAALRSERWSVRRSAAAVLGQMDADWAVEPLIKALHDPYEVVRRMARAALERIATPEAKRALEAITELDVAASVAPAPDAVPLAAPAETPEPVQPAVAPASPPAESTPESQATTKAGVTVTEPSQGPSPEESPVVTPPVVSPVASLPVGEAAPEPKTVIKTLEPIHEPSRLSMPVPSPVLPPGPSTGVITTDVSPSITPPDPTTGANTLVATAPSSDTPTVLQSLPPATEEDTRPTTPVPDDVS